MCERKDIILHDLNMVCWLLLWLGMLSGFYVYLICDQKVLTEIEGVVCWGEMTVTK